MAPRPERVASRDVRVSAPLPACLCLISLLVGVPARYIAFISLWSGKLCMFRGELSVNIFFSSDSYYRGESGQRGVSCLDGKTRVFESNPLL